MEKPVVKPEGDVDLSPNGAEDGFPDDGDATPAIPRTPALENDDDSEAPAAVNSERPAKRKRAAAGDAAAATTTTSAAVGGSTALNAVAKVFVTHLSLNYSEPWRKRGQRSSTGTCFAVELPGTKKRVLLTNAHVVFRATQIRVRRFRDAELYRAKVICLSREMDLALLAVETPEFWSGMSILQFEWNKPCALQDVVVCFGFPQGGDNLSVTRGVVSRHTMQAMVHGGPSLLMTQIDAAINPGNSGGPALAVDGRVIGVSESKLHSSDNIGYIIPPRSVRYFLETYVRDSKQPEICDPGILIQRVESTALRKRLGLPRAMRELESENMMGVLVTRVYPGGALDDHLQLGDVLLEVNGKEIAGDGTIEFDELSGTRLRFTLAIQCMAEVYEHAFVVWRPDQAPKAAAAEATNGGGNATEAKENGGVAGEYGGCIQRFTAALRRTPWLVPRIDGVDASPSYFVFGGLVFVKLTMPWLVDRFTTSSRKRSSYMPPAHLEAFLVEGATGDDVVVLSHILHHDVNYGYQRLPSGLVITSCNGRSVRSLSDLYSIVERTADGAFVVLNMREGGEATGGTLIVLDAKECRAAEGEILEAHRIPTTKSDNVELKPEADLPPPLEETAEAGAPNVDINFLLNTA
mmetsp:Transcript_21102/g.64276  ORF Transcript_21102/g.64276 Transcript_21102/m.64276 type:complete len:635 (-) Transcript_21102:291-2195(-)